MATKKKAAAEVAEIQTNTTPARARMPLTGVQERICDQIADLLVRGGAQINLQRLVNVAFDHQWRKEAIHIEVDRRYNLDQWVAGLVKRDAQEALDELAAARLANRAAPSAERVEPSAAGARIRLRNIERCEDLMEEFILAAHPEEISLLIEVLTTWSSCHLAMQHGYTDIPLAGSFESELGKNRHYVKVPERLVRHVEGYVEALLGTKTIPSLTGMVS